LLPLICYFVPCSWVVPTQGVHPLVVKGGNFHDRIPRILAGAGKKVAPLANNLAPSQNVSSPQGCCISPGDGQVLEAELRRRGYFITRPGFL
jgi:hypothetical protein